MALNAVEPPSRGAGATNRSLPIASEVVFGSPTTLRQALRVCSLVCALLCQPAHAGWFDWLWGSGDREVREAAAMAHETARVANETAALQANQTIRQAEQNAAVATVLGQLSEERLQMADHMVMLAEAARWDSAVGGAIGSLGPVMLTASILAVAGLALWITLRSDDSAANSLLVTACEQWLEPSTPRVPTKADRRRLTDYHRLLGPAASEAESGDIGSDDGPMPF